MTWDMNAMYSEFLEDAASEDDDVQVDIDELDDDEQNKARLKVRPRAAPSDARRITALDSTTTASLLG